MQFEGINLIYRTFSNTGSEDISKQTGLHVKTVTSFLLLRRKLQCKKRIFDIFRQLNGGNICLGEGSFTAEYKNKED